MGVPFVIPSLIAAGVCVWTGLGFLRRRDRRHLPAFLSAVLLTAAVLPYRALQPESTPAEDWAAAGVVAAAATAIVLLGRMPARLRALEQSLLEYKLLFRQLTEHSGNVVYVASPDRRTIRYISPAYGRVWGRPCEELYADGTAWMKAVVDEDRPAVERAIQAGAPCLDCEYRIIRPDGTVRWIRDTDAPACDDTGRPLHFVGIAQDITERRLAEQTLVESEARMRLMLAQIPAIVWTTDRNLTMTSSVGAGLSAVGFKPNQTNGTPLAAYVGGDYPGNPVLEAHRAALEGRPASYDVNWHGRDFQARVEPMHGPDDAVVGIIGVGVDVTERRRAQQALLENEARLRLTLAQLPAVVWTTDRDLVITSSDGLALATLGLKPNQTNGTRLADFLAGDENADRVLEAHRTALAGKPDSYEMNFRGRFFQTRIEPLRGADGTIVGVIGMSVDVTERRLAEIAVRESEERYRVLFQSNPHPMWVYDLQTRRFLAVNDAAVARYGWSVDEFLSMTVDELVWRSDEHAAGAADTDAGGGPIRHRTRGGEVLDVEITSHTITFAGRPARVVLAGDITERLRAERSLRTSEELNRRLLEAVPGGLVYVSADERIIHANREAADFAGVPVDMLIGQHASRWEGSTFNEDGSLCPPADYPTRRCLDTGQAQRGQVIGLKRPDGTMRWGVFSSVPTFEPLTGRRSGAVVTFLDITRRKQAEQALRASEERYRFLFENNPFPMCLYDRQSLRYLQVNDATVRQYGYTREEFATMTIADLRPYQDHAAVRSAVAQLTPGVQNFGFWRHRRKDGTLIDVEITVHTVTLEGRQVVMAMAVDVTERLKAERLLRHRIEFEKLVTGISTRFINLAAEEIDEGVGAALAEIGAFVGADRSYIAMLTEGGDRLECTHEWCAAGIEPQIERFKEIPLADVPWFARWLSAPEAPFWRMVDELPPEAAAEREMMCLQQVQSLMVVPMTYRDRTIGLLGFDSVREKRAWTDDDVALLKIVGEIFVNAFQRRRSEDELRKLAGRLSAAEDAERRCVAQDIHDSIGQTLSVVKLNLESAARDAGAGRPEPGRLARSLELVDALIEQTRSLTFDLYPAMLDDLGLLPTLRWFAEQFLARTGIRVTVTDNARVPPLPTAIANYLFRAVKELLANAAKHGRASEALVAVHGHEDGLRIVVADDGCGFEPTAALAPGRRRGLGLAGIRERVVSLGGRFFVESCPGQGTEIILEVPLERQATASVQ